MAILVRKNAQFYPKNHFLNFSQNWTGNKGGAANIGLESRCWRIIPKKPYVAGSATIWLKSVWSWYLEQSTTFAPWCITPAVVGLLRSPWMQNVGKNVGFLFWPRNPKLANARDSYGRFCEKSWKITKTVEKFGFWALTRGRSLWPLPNFFSELTPRVPTKPIWNLRFR